MIISGLLNFSAFLLNTVLSIFPDSSGIPTGFTTAVDYFAGYVGILDPLVPLDTLGTVFLIILTYELSVWGFRGFRWVISHIPLVGGRG